MAGRSNSLSQSKHSLTPHNREPISHPPLVILGSAAAINTTSPPPHHPSLTLSFSICNKSQQPTTTRGGSRRPTHCQASKSNLLQRDGDVHGRQEQDAVQEREPEVDGDGGRGEPSGGGGGAQGGPVGAGPAGEPGEGAEGQVLHHAPLRHHARVLEGLALEPCGHPGP